jgi:hypothetical protein
MCKTLPPPPSALPSRAIPTSTNDSSAKAKKNREKKKGREKERERERERRVSISRGEMQGIIGNGAISV